MKVEKIQREPYGSNNYVNSRPEQPYFSGGEPKAEPLSVPDLDTPHQFTPGRPAHHHPPLGNWAQVQSESKDVCLSINPNTIDCACAFFSPARVLSMASSWEMFRSPVAKAHLNHYLTGNGAVFNENDNLRELLAADPAVRKKFADEIRAGKNSGEIGIWQGDFTVKDYALAFGSIDRVDFQASLPADRMDIWFKDMYEFHPVGFGHVDLGEGDIARLTNCVHAAAVELKSQGAADFWMQGGVSVSLNSILQEDNPDDGWW